MADLWFFLLAALLTAYVVLDGFDLGAGAVHRILAKSDRERRAIIAAIGPFWDGNEVFLLAAGGTLFLAFSQVLAAALSGLYLAVILVLWAIVLRGISLELRSHLPDGMWRSFWDVVFQGSSGVLALLLGVALGNVLRGFPFEEDGYFALDLFSLASPRHALGVVDGYTLAMGLLSLLVLASHGSRFVALRTEGPLADRATHLAQRATGPILAGWLGISVLSWLWAPDAVRTFLGRPVAWPLPLIALAALGAAWERGRRGRVKGAFLASCVLVVALLGTAAASVYPTLLRSTTPAPSLTVRSAANPDVTLAAGLRWWFVAAGLVALWFANLVRAHRGHTTPYGEGGDQDLPE